MITTLPFYTILITLLYYLHTFYLLCFLIFLFPSFSLISFQKSYPQLIHLSTKLSTYQHIIVFSISPYISYFFPIPPHFIFSINFFIFPLDNAPLLCYTLVSQLRNPIKHWHFHSKILNVLLVIKTD